jgi:GT2 family glycosyltransferase
VTNTVAGVINYNQADLTLRTVESLRSNTMPNDLRVYVIDSASREDDVERLAESLPADVELHRLPANGGFGHAVNALLELAKRNQAEWVWVLNNDIEVEGGALDFLLESGRRHPSIAAVAPVVVSSETPTCVLSAGMDVDLWRGRVLHRHWHDRIDALPLVAYAVGAVEGSAPLIRLRAIDLVGGFDEGFFMYWEDVEWSRRAIQAGWRLLIDPRARVRHDVGRSSAPIDRTLFMLRNRVRFMRIAAGPAHLTFFLVYFIGFWLPAYLVARLIPRFGLGAGVGVVRDVVIWNLRDALGRHPR